MDDIVYSNNPNEDSAQVKVENKFHKASLVRSVGDSEVIYQDNVNVDKVLFTGEDGKKHTASLTKDIGNAEVIYENNPNIGKVLFTGEDGKKHTATLVKNIDGGSAPVIDELNVTPSTSAQQITAPEGTDGYSPVNVAAVTSSIDANIVAGNIKKDVNILGVTGSYEGQTPTANVELQVLNGVFGGKFSKIDLIGVTEYASNILNNSQLNHEYFSNATGNPFVNADNLTTISGTNTFNGTFYRSNATTFSLPSLTTITGISTCYCMFYSGKLTEVSLPSLTTISGNQTFYQAFRGNVYLTSVNISALTTISGVAAARQLFSGCSALVSIDLHSLKTINDENGFRNAFNDCTSLTNVDLSSLQTISGKTCLSYLFENCTSLTTVSFPALKSTSFGSYTDQFDNMLAGCSNVTVHFPSNLQSVIGSWASVTGGFGGTNTTVLYDLPATA